MCVCVCFVFNLFKFLFSFSLKFTRYSLYWAKPGKLDEKELSAVINKCNFSNWMFLFFLRSNLSEFLFKKVIYHLASEFPDEQRDNSINDSLARDHAHIDPSHMQTLRIDEVDRPLLNKPSSSNSKID